VTEAGVMYEYKVIEIREKMFGSKMSGAALERLLNDNAAHGWQLKAITSADVRGRVGPGGVEGLLVTFERMRG
jgi:Domain of unknown function (DUF4177)